MSDWIKQAACVGLDVEIFFDIRGKKVQLPLSVCADCPVRVECLNETLKIEKNIPYRSDSVIWGVFGGATPKDRYELGKMGDVVTVEKDGAINVKNKKTH